MPGARGVGDRGGDPHAPRWIIDPLDGTTNFAHGHPFFCISLGLFTEEGEGLAGVVHAPALATTVAEGVFDAGLMRNVQQPQTMHYRYEKIGRAHV